jgi:hypothetical protein
MWKPVPKINTSGSCLRANFSARSIDGNFKVDGNFKA